MAAQTVPASPVPSNQDCSHWGSGHRYPEPEPMNKTTLTQIARSNLSEITLLSLARVPQLMGT